MNDDNRSMFANAALSNLPPAIVGGMLEDHKFVADWGIDTTTTISLGSDGPSFDREKLFQVIRIGLRSLGVEQSVSDVANDKWQFKVMVEDEKLEFLLFGKSARYRLTSHAALSPEPRTRLSWFDEVAAEDNLSDTQNLVWRDRLLRQDDLRDEEFVALIQSVLQNPVETLRKLRSGLEKATAEVSCLIPLEKMYYERYVGDLGDGSLEGYLAEGALEAINRWQAWKSEDGLRFALSLCSVAKLSEGVVLPEVSDEHLADIFSRIASDGDPLSKVAAVEVALTHCDTHPGLQAFIEMVVEDFISDDPNEENSDFALFSWISVLIGSQLSRRKVLSDFPPFYRKQAALAQASLVMRAFSGSAVDRGGAVRWAKDLRWALDFYLQGLVDLRLEPRWLPDFISPDQIRADFLGRVRNAAAANETKITSDTLRSQLVGVGSRLTIACEWPLSSFPGPLEGSLKSQGSVPSHFLDSVRESLKTEVLNAQSFAGLVNLSMVDVLPGDLAELAATALKRVRFSIENLDDDASIFRLISGLAVVAAVSRSGDLSEAVCVLARVLRRRKRFKPEANDEVRIALVAAAAFEDETRWSSSVGEWLTEVAFDISDKEQGSKLLSLIRELVRCAPTLRRHLSKAQAALTAFTG